MAYRLAGTYYETCPCNVLCPCSASSLVLPADVERCTVVLGFKVSSGEVDGVDVSGAAVAMVVDAPQQMTDGGWRVGLLVDSNTSEEQRGKLVEVFSGEQGGRPRRSVRWSGKCSGSSTPRSNAPTRDACTACASVTRSTSRLRTSWPPTANRR